MERSMERGRSLEIEKGGRWEIERNSEMGRSLKIEKGGDGEEYGD